MARAVVMRSSGVRGMALVTVMASLGFCLAWVAMRVNKEQPDPYMVSK